MGSLSVRRVSNGTEDDTFEQVDTILPETQSSEETIGQVSTLGIDLRILPGTL